MPSSRHKYYLPQFLLSSYTQALAFIKKIETQKKQEKEMTHYQEIMCQNQTTGWPIQTLELSKTSTKLNILKYLIEKVDYMLNRQAIPEKSWKLFLKKGDKC